MFTIDLYQNVGKVGPPKVCIGFETCEDGLVGQTLEVLLADVLREIMGITVGQ